MAIVQTDAAFISQVVDVVQHHRRRVDYEHPTPSQPGQPRKQLHVGFLTSALAASTDPRLPWDEQPTATALIYRHDADGNLAEGDDTVDEVTIYSRRDAAFSTDTFVEFVWKWGRWQLVDANCSASVLT